MGEVLLVDGVHLGEVVHGGDEYVDLEERSLVSNSNFFVRYLSPWMKMAHLNSTVNAATSVLEDVLKRLAAGLGLVGDAATDEVTLGVGGDLARDPDLAGGFNGLGLWMMLGMALRGFEVMFARNNGYDISREDSRSVPRLNIHCQQFISLMIDIIQSQCTHAARPSGWSAA